MLYPFIPWTDPVKDPWEHDAMYSECGQTFFEPDRMRAHQAICGYCIRAIELKRSMS